jgi:hypothetical protein
VYYRTSEKTQTTLIVVWLVEIYQNRLAALREGGADEKAMADAQAEFRAFLAQPRVDECIR